MSKVQSNKAPKSDAKKSKKAKNQAEVVEILQTEEEVKIKTKGGSNLNIASKKIQKQVVEIRREDDNKKAVKQEKKKENSEKKTHPTIKERKASHEESDVLDVKTFSQVSKEKAEEYAKCRRKTVASIPLDKHQIKNAIDALITYYNNNKKKNQLLDNGEDFIYLEIILSEVPSTYSIRPTQV